MINLRVPAVVAAMIATLAIASCHKSNEFQGMPVEHSEFDIHHSYDEFECRIKSFGEREKLETDFRYDDQEFGRSYVATFISGNAQVLLQNPFSRHRFRALLFIRQGSLADGKILQVFQRFNEYINVKGRCLEGELKL
jgi:hypothetical protein